MVCILPIPRTLHLAYRCPNLTLPVCGQDGTLTDSISAVEAAWGKVARDIGQDPAHVIAATHGKRAVDNLAMFKPHIKAHEMDDEVTNFEETILYFADAYNMHGPGSQPSSRANTTINTPESVTPMSSGFVTPALTPGSSAPSSRASSFISSQSRRPSFASRLHSMLNMSAVPESGTGITTAYHSQFEDPVMEEDHTRVVEAETEKQKRERHCLEAWQQEAAGVDRSVRILPGVKRIMDSIPAGKYAVATSGAKTYGMFDFSSSQVRVFTLSFL